MRISWHVCIVLSCVGPLFAANKPGTTPTGRNEVLAILRDESRTSGDVVNRRVALTGLRTENSAAETWWQSGFVKSAGEWISYDAVRNDDSLMEHYRRWRAAAAPGATAQFQLANRCRDAGLTDQERVHLSRGLWTGNVSSPERYLTRLGYRLVGNQWFTPDELRAGEQEFQAANLAWRKLESRWERLASWLDGTPKQRTAALAELKSLNSASNLAVFEQYLAPTSESAGQAVVLVAQELDSYRASQALARLAIGSPWRSVQTQAIEALRNRPYEHYVPLVLSVLHTPISAQFRADLNADSRAATPVLNAELRMVLTSEGRGRIQMTEWWLVDHRPIVNGGAGRPAPAELAVAAVPDELRAVSDGVYLTMRQTEVWNDRIGELNRRAGRILAEVSGEPESDNPRTWWSWWDRMTGVDWSYDKPVDYEYQTQETTRPYAVVVPSATGNLRSCLAAGTPIWTDRGLMAVDRIQPGDCVLSKNVETGELAYKPVLHTTQRSDAGVRTVRVEAETWLASLGHQFWISGHGWQRVNQLNEPTRAHTVTGTAIVTTEYVGEKQDVFNLVVADFHTYFVGTSMVLSHDVLTPEPTDAKVPGLAP